MHLLILSKYKETRKNMAKVTAKYEDFKSYLISMLGMMYVLGAQGHKFVDLLDRLCAMEKNDCKKVQNILTLFKKKLDMDIDIYTLLAFDCSGLGMKWLIEHGIFKYDMTAAEMYKSIPDKISSLNSVKAGDFVFTDSLGHVGYVIDDDMVIEARGTAYGVVMTDLYKREWTKAARPDWWIDVDSKPILRRELKLTDPYMKGDDVKEAQTLLAEKGYNPGTIDGVFGRNTEIASKNFKHDNGLSYKTGTIGKKTAEKLGFIWEG